MGDTVNRSALYWKWDSDVLDPETLKNKVRDLTSRTQIGNIFIGVEWLHTDYFSDSLACAFRTATAALHRAGRKAILECCIRGEGVPFYEAYPGEPSFLVTVRESLCREDGSIRIPHEQVWHYWRHSGDRGEHQIFALYRLEKEGPRHYRRAQLLHGFTSRAVMTEQGYAIEITAPCIRAGDLIAAVVGFPQPIVDLAHPALPDYFRKMARHAAALGADGLFSDEWGYSVILDIKTPNPYDDKDLSIAHLSYSAHMEQRYRAMFGESLLDRLLDLFYQGAPDRKCSIDRYLRILRLICTETDEAMYAITKEELGPDAFWGVHPTWWGSRDEQYMEFFKNGFYWWDARRDLAQTDECVIMPIRTALAHRFSSPVWYNMWYSLGTRDIRTYYPESWRNLRYGGRTHYLGYECPNEAVVLDLRPAGLLESIEAMDARIRLFDSISAQPDCRVLLLFGFEAVSNWDALGMAPPWGPVCPRLMELLQTADSLFEKYLCDLVPSYAAENGSLSLDEAGRLHYGSQVYDAVIALYPDSMGKEARALLAKLGPKTTILCCTDSANGFSQLPSASTLAELLHAMGIHPNRTENGCRLQDGSMIFTADGKKATGNPLCVDTELNGHHICFEGCDSLWVSADCTRAIFPEGNLQIDQQFIKSMR